MKNDIFLLIDDIYEYLEIFKNVSDNISEENESCKVELIFWCLCYIFLVVLLLKVLLYWQSNAKSQKITTHFSVLEWSFRHLNIEFFTRQKKEFFRDCWLR